MRTYSLSPDSKTPLYEQLYQALKTDILSGAVAGGEKLPSKRTLAEHLNISHVTVETAYQQLLSEGYITSRPKSGYYAETLEALPQPPRQTLPPVSPNLPVTPGSSAGQFPFSVWAKLMRRVLLEDQQLLLHSPPAAGLPALRQAIAGMLLRSRGISVNPEHIVIGAGAEYLYSILILLLGRDLCYGLENPGHRKIRQVYTANGVSVVPLPLDADGVLPERLLQTPVRVLHISPGHQYPTGVIMPIARRRQLMNWAAGGEDRWIIEDDYDSEFHFTGRPAPSMAHMDTLGRVIYLNTFSRTITPALRISYMILPHELMDRYHRQLGFYSCTVPVLEQLTLAAFLEEGHFERHVSRMKRRYRLLREDFFRCLHQSPKADAIRVSGDEAGLHFLLHLQTHLTDDTLDAAFRAKGIPAACLSHYAADLPRKDLQGKVILSYADLSPEDVPRVVAELEQLIC